MNCLKQSLTQSYSQKDVREITNIALANHSTLDTELSYSQLLEIAQELFSSGDAALVADMVKIGVNQALQTAQKKMSDAMSKLVPPGLAGMF